MEILEITKDFTPELIKQWKDKNFEVDLVTLHKDLLSVITEEELPHLEPEYVESEIYRQGIDVVIPAIFLNKISALVALNTNIGAYTSSPFMFMNTVAVANDLSAPFYSVQKFSPHQISRTLSVIEEVTPNAMNVTGLTFSDTVLDYIFECYYFSDHYILDKRLQEYTTEFLEESKLQETIVKTFKIVADHLSDLEYFIENIKITSSNVKELLAPESENNKITSLVTAALEKMSKSEAPELVRVNLVNYVIYSLYDKFYDEITESLTEKSRSPKK